MRLLSILMVFLVPVSMAHAQTGSPAAGVPLDVATARAANITDLTMTCRCQFPTTSLPPFPARTPFGSR